MSLENAVTFAIAIMILVSLIGQVAMRPLSRKDRGE